jgi:hypothetical protein
LASKAKKEKVMKNNAWKIGTLVAISVLVLLSSTSAYGQTSTRFNIPFQFLAGDCMMPAGQYLVRVDLASHSLSLRHESGVSLMALRVIPGRRSLDAAEEGRLLFRDYGNVRALARVWTRGFQDANDLRVSKVERELAGTEHAGPAVEIAFAAAR